MDNEVLNLCLSLNKNIKNGDINEVVKSVEDLARLKPLIKIMPDKIINDKWKTEYCELTKVIVQDSDEETAIEYYISNYATIRELKQQVRVIKRNL